MKSETVASKPGRNPASEFSLRETVQKILHRWCMMPLLSLLGAILGWGFHQMQPPLYEARAVFTVNINYNFPDVLDKIDDTHYAEDQMIVAVMSGMQAREVLDQVIEKGVAFGIRAQDLVVGKRIFVERKTSEILLIVRHHNPQVAVDLANFWAERALEYLKEGQAHALHTYTLNQKIKNLAACIQSGQDGICQELTKEELENQLHQTEVELKAEVQASRSLNPAILFNFSRPASPPDTPVVFQSQVLVLSGAFIGFLFSLIAGQWTGLPKTGGSG